MKMTNVIIVTDDSGRVRQFRFPGFLPAILAMIFLLSAGGFLWVVDDYRTVRSQIVSLEQLKKDSELKKKQVSLLAKRVDLVSRKVKGLKQFDIMLKGMVSTAPDDEEGQFRGVGGTDFLFQAQKGKTDKGGTRTEHKNGNIRDAGKAGSTAQKTTENLERLMERQNAINDHVPSIWPVKGWMVESFGSGPGSYTGENGFNSGINISTRDGVPIVATAEGLVSNIEWRSSSGWVVTINHGNGVVTRYNNLHKVLVGKESYVMKGEPIAQVGSSAINKNSYLQYEILLNRVPVNPVDYLPN